MTGALGAWIGDVTGGMQPGVPDAAVEADRVEEMPALPISGCREDDYANVIMECKTFLSGTKCNILK